MELSLAQELEGIIERLVTSGQRQLDKPLLKKLKLFCKGNDDNLRHCFQLIISQLHKDHAEVRLSAFQIVNELFMRSHLFRQLLLDMFNEYMDLTMEVDFENPLPPPRHIAEKLKSDSLVAMKAWHDKYGIAYSKLALAMHFLQNVKKIKFDAATPQNNVERQVESSRNAQRQIINGMKLDKLTKTIDKNLWEIKQCATEIKNCLLLLVPNFEDPDENLKDVILESESATSAVTRDTGLPRSGYSLQIDLSTISKMHVNQTQDNKAVIDRTKDLTISAHRIYLPRIRSWISMGSKCNAPSALIKQLIDVKFDLQEALRKYKDLNLSGAKDIGSDSDESDIDDFEEVPEAGENLKKINGKKLTPKLNKAKAIVPASSQSDTNVWKPMKTKTTSDSNDPTSYQHALEIQAKKRKMHEQQVKTSSKKLQKIIPKLGKKRGETTLYDKAPVVSFGKDLLAWDKERENELKETLMMGTAKEYDIGHRFWSGTSASEGDAGVSDAALTSLTTCTIEFTGEFKPVTRCCNAPLPNGRLCPRQDRYKCPFHGKIIERDASGNPIDGTKPSTSQSASSAWNDPEFLKDIERSSEGKIKLKKKKQSRQEKQGIGLTDLKKIHDTSRSRLQKKIFSAGSIKRVAGTLDNLDDKRNRDKFGNNFNYALN
uniref:UV-stimulated scaffold protein A n=1 Tax=Phallusia mammillata TaxID=59560 RepID=A0A6F9DX33_9ASCI|nr:UV-stimulated scaffold protein A-like [Phallusia mammillata]